MSNKPKSQDKTRVEVDSNNDSLIILESDKKSKVR